MKGIRSYTTSTAFRRALEDRLNVASRNERVDLQRFRKEVAFDRFLARLFHSEFPRWVLKGGYAMELRIKEARSTKDIDLALRETLSQKKGLSQNMAILANLRQSVQKDLNDFFTFFVGEPTHELEAAPYGGARFPIEAQMEGRIFVRFHVDIAIGDVIIEPLDITKGRDWLAFAGIKPHPFQTISIEQQFAEKIHAYTLPRPRTNTRVRDLVDLLLLLRNKNMRQDKTASAIRTVFYRRKTHPIPFALMAPPPEWESPFAHLMKECGLRESMEEVFMIVAQSYSGLALR